MKWILGLLLVVGGGRSSLLNSDAAEPMAVEMETTILPVVVNCPHIPFFPSFHFGYVYVKLSGLLASICPFKYDPQTLNMYLQMMNLSRTSCGSDPIEWATCSSSWSQLLEQSYLWRNHPGMELFAETRICGTLDVAEKGRSNCDPRREGYFYTKGMFYFDKNVTCMYNEAQVMTEHDPFQKKPPDAVTRGKGGKRKKKKQKTTDAKPATTTAAKPVGTIAYEMCMARFVHPTTGHSIRIMNSDLVMSNVPAYLKHARHNNASSLHFLNESATRHHAPQWIVTTDIPLHMLYNLTQLRRLEHRLWPHHERLMERVRREHPETHYAPLPKGKLGLSQCSIVTSLEEGPLTEWDDITKRYPPLHPVAGDGSDTPTPAQRAAEEMVGAFQTHLPKFDMAMEQHDETPEQVQSRIKAFLDKGRPLSELQPLDATAFPNLARHRAKTATSATPSPYRDKVEVMHDKLKTIAEQMEALERDIEANEVRRKEMEQQQQQPPRKEEEEEEEEEPSQQNVYHEEL